MNPQVVVEGSGMMVSTEGLSPTPSLTGWLRRGQTLFRSITRRESAPHRAMTGLSDAASNRRRRLQ